MRGASIVFEGLTTTPCECAEDVTRRDGDPCASKPVLGAIAKFAATLAAPADRVKQDGLRNIRGIAPNATLAATLPAASTPEAKAVRDAAAALGCDSESCVIGHPALRPFIPPAVAAAELDERYKVRGPRASTALLSNFDIDGTLRKWAKVFTDFYPCPFAMMDFAATGEAFECIPLPDVLAGRVPADLGGKTGVVRRPCRTFGCVVNTDTSRGRGKHWVAVFVDCRALPWTIEYFNSAGRPPPRPMVGWMEKSRAALEGVLASTHPEVGQRAEVETVAVTDVCHQQSQTECGLYALFYIRRRLEGAAWTVFAGETIVPDSAMTEFRKHVFRG